MTPKHRFFDTGYASDQGLRSSQEDHLGIKQYDDGSLLAVLADGMGGHAGGAVASEMAVRLFGEYFPTTTGNLSQRLQAALQQTNQHMAEQARTHKELHNMGATLLVVYAHNQMLHWLSVGDSLLYRFSREAGLQQLNQLHTVRERFRQLLAAGRISGSEYTAMEDPHALTSALGLDKLHEVDCQSAPLGSDELLILASDGLLTLEPTTVATLLDSSQPAQLLADRLVKSTLSRQRRNQDNISVIVIRKQPRPLLSMPRLLPAVTGMTLVLGALGGIAYLFNTLQARNAEALEANLIMQQQAESARQKQQETEAALEAKLVEAQQARAEADQQREAKQKAEQKAALEAKAKARAEQRVRQARAEEEAAKRRLQEERRKPAKTQLQPQPDPPVLPAVPDNVPGLPELPLPPALPPPRMQAEP